MLSERSADNITRSYFRLHKSFVELSAVFQTFEKLSNFKGLVFEFYLNRKRNKCWLVAYSCDLFTYQEAYIGRNASVVIDRMTLPDML